MFVQASACMGMAVRPIVEAVCSAWLHVIADVGGRQQLTGALHSVCVTMALGACGSSHVWRRVHCRLIPCCVCKITSCWGLE
jgi:hypothetical protein